MPSVLSPLIAGVGGFLHSLDCRVVNGHGGGLSSDSAALQMAAKLRSPTQHLATPAPPPLPSHKAEDAFVPSSPSSPSSPATPLSDPSVPPSPDRHSSLSSSASASPPFPPTSSCFLQPTTSLSLPPQLPPASLLGPAQLSAILQQSARLSSPSPPPLQSDLSLAPPSSFPSPDLSASPSPSPSPIPFHYSPPYADDSLATRQLKFIYRVYHHVCDIYFAVDKGQRTRCSTPSHSSTSRSFTLLT